jgi:hypothetical protein
VTWAKVLGWRLRRQLLDPVGTGSVLDVVERLGAVPAWPDPTMELAVGARRTDGGSGDAARALAANEVVKVFAFRGGMQLMTPQDAGAYLAVRASSRMWELPSWVSYYGLAAGDWPRFREYVRDALADGPLTLPELTAAFGRSSRYRHLRGIIEAGNETVLKPLSWQGDMGFAPPRDGETTFRRLDDVPGWAGLPDLDEAGPRVVAAYLHSYGPATRERIHDRVGTGLGAKRQAVTRWLSALDERLDTLTLDGEELLVLTEDLDDLATAPASAAVRLLPARDPWVMAPGSTDAHVVPPARRELVSRSANLVVHRGALAGTWSVRGSRLEVAWFMESGRIPRTALDTEAARLGRFLDPPTDLELRLSDAPPAVSRRAGGTPA